MPEEIRACGCWFSLNTGPNGECENCGLVPCADAGPNRILKHSVNQDGVCALCNRSFPGRPNASSCQLCKSGAPVMVFVEARGHLVLFEPLKSAWIPCTEKDRELLKGYEEKLKTA